MECLLVAVSSTTKNILKGKHTRQECKWILMDNVLIFFSDHSSDYFKSA